MAVIGKIREKSYLLLIVIGVAMLAFILGDFFRSGQPLGGASNEIGEIGDIKVKATEFNFKLDQAVSNWEAQNQRPANQQIREAITDQVWNEIVSEQLLGNQYKELGIAVSPEELFDLVQGSDPHPQVRQAFTDPNTGQFSSTQVIQFLKSLETMPVENKNQWLAFEKGIQKERVAKKYNNLLSKGMIATTNMAKHQHVSQSETRSFRFVAKRYTTVHDSSITVTSDEMRAYYNDHKEEYKQDVSRGLEYVKFDVIPSGDDTAKAENWINDIVEEFKLSENDSNFVIFNSDQPLDPNYYSANNLPSNLDEEFFASEQGTMVGPYREGGSFVLAKLSKIKMVPDSVKARHILLKVEQPGDSTAYNRLDSLKTIIEQRGGFAELAKEISEDVGSAIEGGDLGWFQEGAMVKPFNDACFDGKKRDLVIVQSQFGFHLIEVLDQSPKVRKVQIAKVIRDIVPSNETYDLVFAKASGFYAENNSGASFAEGGSDQIVRNVEVKINDKNIAGLDAPREMIRWAFNSDKDDVSTPFQFGQTFVVARVSNVKEEGFASMDEVQLQVEIGAKKRKKAQLFMEEMSGQSSLEDLAAKVGTSIEQANNVQFSSYAIPSLGQEPAVMGVASVLEKGQLSEPVEGNTGVFVLLLDDVTPSTELEDYSMLQQQLELQYASRSLQVLEALKDKYGVVDQRYKFY